MPAVTEKAAAKKTSAAKSGAGSSGAGSSTAADPGPELVGQRVKVWWPGEKAWFEGQVAVRTA
jgi:hypothetical protein